MSLAVCLAGGGVKGAAHIGVLKAIEEENLEYDYITGTSSGSIVASLNAMGHLELLRSFLFGLYYKFPLPLPLLLLIFQLRHHCLSHQL